MLDYQKSTGDTYKGRLRSLILRLRHEEGIRAFYAGHVDEAVSKLREADERSLYWTAGEGRFKLFNLANLAQALERANDPAGAAAALAKIREVNPSFAANYPRMIADLDPKR